MTFIADDNVPDPVIQALLAVKFDIKRIKDIVATKPDYSVMQSCLEENGILVTFDLGIPSQAYYYEFAKNGLTVVLLRWKRSTYRDWQEMVEIILRDAHIWKEAASKESSIISVSYKRGSRVRFWSTIPPLIAQQAIPQEKHPSKQGHLF